MNIKKMSGSFAVAISVLALCAPTMADDCTEVSDGIKAMAYNLQCKPEGAWDTEAIWQWKGKGELGCAVHAKLAKQLHVPFDPDKPPPKKKGNNIAKGAANSLDDHKYQDAIDHLQNFWDTIEYNARLNSDDREDNREAEALADEQQEIAQMLIGQIDPLNGCAP